MELQSLCNTNVSRLIYAHVYKNRIYTIFHYYEHNLGDYLRFIREDSIDIHRMEEELAWTLGKNTDKSIMDDYDSATDDSFEESSYTSKITIEEEGDDKIEYTSDDRFEYCNSRKCVLPFLQIIGLIKQLLTAVNICHSRGIIHRNIKPKHILVQPGPDRNNPLKDATLKLSDFALVKNVGLLQRTSTMEVVTLWYRAPEILLGRDSYNSELDMWSVGCVIE